MSLLSNLPFLLAQAQETVAQNNQSFLGPIPLAEQFEKLPNFVTVPTVLLLAVVLPFFLGWLIARAVKMPTYSWRIGLILCTIFASIVTIALGWPPKLGVDLKGGYIMIWQIDEQAQQERLAIARRGGISERDEQSNQSALIEGLKRRLNPDGLKEIAIRAYGPNEVEIIVPETDPAEIRRLKDQILAQGFLEFMIVADHNQDSQLFDAARSQAEGESVRRRLVSEGDKVIGKWVKVGRDDEALDGVHPFRLSGPWPAVLVRDGATGRIIDTSGVPGGEVATVKWFAKENHPDIDVLMKVSESYRITGDDLRISGVYGDVDETANPCVNFAFKSAASERMAGLTGSNIGRQLAIVLDDTLLSAANIKSQISDQGRITGRFSQAEVDFVIRILKAGSLPATLRRSPVYEEPSDPTLGAENIRQGAIAVILSLALVFAFCLVYYRFAGLVACIALAMNMLLTIGAMILLGATLTMPGLAGMVLTVGMSVDANVLIFERMREELARGASLRMAIRNGFDRALSAIVDGNLTTLLIAIILYVIGTEQLVGFAVTLTLGIMISMFTAIFCSRVIFDVAERNGMLRSLNFMQFLTKSNIDFVRYMGVCITASVVLIGIGLAAAAYRGAGIFDIDLRGGTSIQVSLREPITSDEMNALLTPAFANETYEGSRVDYSLKAVGREINGKHTSYRIDTISPDKEHIQDLLAGALKKDGHSLLVHYEVSYTPPVAKSAMQLGGKREMYFTAYQQPEADATPGDEAVPAATPVESEQPAIAPTATTDVVPEPDTTATPAVTEKPLTEKEGTVVPAPVAVDPLVDRGPKPVAPINSSGKNPKTGDTNDPNAPQPVPAGSSDKQLGDVPLVTTSLKFGDTTGTAEGIDQPAVLNRLQAAAKKLNIDTLRIIVNHPAWDNNLETRRTEWNASFSTTAAEAEKILAEMRTDLDDAPVWLSSKTIGGQIAGDFVKIAVVALIVSLLGIIAYVWFRFQNVAWGFAAVVALIHDVLFMLAGIAVSYWLAGALGFLGVTEFKIDLTVIAAFLTLIGYSINDTIVVFDRMREIKGKLPVVNRQIVNDSVNQTLSRSILTFLTTFVTVVVLYAVGGPGIHGFAYAMLIGTFVGMYSTVFIAAPFLLWLVTRPAANKAATVR